MHPRVQTRPHPKVLYDDDGACFTRHTAKAPEADAIECDELFHTYDPTMTLAINSL